MEHLEIKNYAAAQQKFLRSLVHKRDDLVARLNIAFTFELMGDREKASQEYLSIINSDLFTNNPDLFYAYFNLAKIYGDLKNIDKALEAYQIALKFQPESVEVKTNIELLIQDGGGGGGGSDDQKQEQPQDPQGQDPQEQNQEQQKPNPEDLNKSDMKKIFEELKNQEQKIRELEYGEGVKKDSGGKDW